MKRWLAAALLASLCGCDGPGFRFGTTVLVYDAKAAEVDGWWVKQGGEVRMLHAPVGLPVVWLGSGFKVEGEPGVWDRVRVTPPTDDPPFVGYLPHGNLRAAP